MSRWSGRRPRLLPGGAIVKYSTSVPSGRVIVWRETGESSTSAIRSALMLVTGTGWSPTRLVRYTSLGRSGQDAVNTISERPARAEKPSIWISPPTISRLAACPMRARWRATEPAVGDHHGDPPGAVPGTGGVWAAV